ncbi:Alpha/Beta hydrolase protein, partial [Thamnocephalis sphaerospora]
TFGALEWSADEKLLVYVAERKVEESKAKDFDYTQTWGETFGKKSHPNLVLVTVDSGDIQFVNHGANNWAPGQPIFSANGEQLYFTAYETTPRRYGIRACQNRPAGIFRSRLNGSALERISDEDTSARSPRLTPDGSAVVFLANELGGAHAACAALVKFTVETGKTEKLVPIVDEPKEAAGFPGLFVENLPRRCWLSTASGQTYLVTHTSWRSRRVLVAVHLASGQVHNLTPGARQDGCDESCANVEDGWVLVEAADAIGCSCGISEPQGASEPSWTALDAFRGLLVASRTAPDLVNDLQLGVLSVGDDERPALAWSKIHQPALGKAAKLLETIDYSVVAFPERHAALEVVLVQPAKQVVQKATAVGGRKPPLIVYPHGGPHAAYATDYSPYVSALVSLGFAVSLVNYTGSTGFGNKAVKDLIGRIGELEIEDTHYTALRLNERGVFDTERTCLTGGSHGGFTSAHLLGRYPEYYRACVMRNPVINVGAMAAATDIPDWCFAEAGLAYDFAKPTSMTPEEYAKVYAMSPVSVISHVRTPTLMMLGDNDQRVPHSEGLSWVHTVRGHGKAKVGCKMYPDNGHSLDGVEAEVAGFEALAGWFLEHVACRRAN